MKPLGISLIALAVFFNLPFARLASTFDYPDILRQPPETILAAFTAGGPGLILTWYAFALAALLFLPVGIAHALADGRMRAQPELAVAAAITAAFAGLLQAMGLLRWVLVVPGLAQSGDVAGFALIHAYAGTALGEHLGQLLTAAHVGLIAVMQMRERSRLLAGLGSLTALVLLVGAFEGPMLAMGQNGAAFAMAAIAGYLLLTVWLIAAGLALILGNRISAVPSPMAS